jgi:hypothetical protein
VVVVDIGKKGRRVGGEGVIYRQEAAPTSTKARNPPSRREVKGIVRQMTPEESGRKVRAVVTLNIKRERPSQTTVTSIGDVRRNA